MTIPFHNVTVRQYPHEYTSTRERADTFDIHGDRLRFDAANELLDLGLEFRRTP